ncbi:hypothetical protein KJ951_03395 [Patescibacteria group bacterium]|nr:hypothetical protein [Patescibacteria group bacterium]MBU1703423.1 hypothetical protein [Patescibacteria group bacterium]MBU1953504.1 hypothetical protein [Patescibacteria group bacterium]
MKNKKGEAVLIGVVIISMIILIIGISMTMLNLSVIQISRNHTNATTLYVNTEGCAEESLIRLNRHNDYTGETLVIDTTTCIIIVSGSGGTRTINISASDADYTRKLQIGVILSPFSISSWQDITT